MRELDVPIVIKTNSVRNVTNKPIQGIESEIEREILLPSSTCTVSSSLSCEKFVGIIVNKEYCFSKYENLKIEDKWFEKLPLMCTDFVLLWS